MTNKTAFNNTKYLNLQSKHIADRINGIGGKLYLEFGGKLFDDYHASRVLPGFEPDSKLKMLLELKNQAEVIVAICAKDIENNHTRGDSGITYAEEALRLIDLFREVGIPAMNIVITQYDHQISVDKFKQKAEELGVKVSYNYFISNYPNNIELIVSKEGYGKNDFVKTEKPLVIVTAPGPGSGKMAVCLSQLYHEHKSRVKAGYAKFETFPIWNLPLKHPVNLAYEAATADLNDMNMIDPFHLEEYGKIATSYNRDVEAFALLKQILSEITSDITYKSPTDMGVNYCGYCIENDEEVQIASKNEIIRRFFKAKYDNKVNNEPAEPIRKIESIMSQLGLKSTDRKTVASARNESLKINCPTLAIELPTGQVVTGKTSQLLSASSSALLNSLKELASIDDCEHIISPDVLKPVQELKVNVLGDDNLVLNCSETLLALSISAVENPNSAKALRTLDQLKGSEAHSTAILTKEEIDIFSKLKINLTMDSDFDATA